MTFIVANFWPLMRRLYIQSMFPCFYASYSATPSIYALDHRHSHVVDVVNNRLSDISLFSTALRRQKFSTER